VGPDFVRPAARDADRYSRESMATRTSSTDAAAGQLFLLNAQITYQNGVLRSRSGASQSVRRHGGVVPSARRGLVEPPRCGVGKNPSLSLGHKRVAMSRTAVTSNIGS